MLNFKSKRIVRSGTCRFNASPECIIPLLCPVREKEWVGGWDYRMIYSDSGLNEKGCTFKNRFFGGEALWTVVSYSKENYEFEAVIFVKNRLVVNFYIKLNKNDGGTTDARITQTFTALSGKGNKFIGNNTEEKYAKTMAGIEKSMNYFLEHGRMIGGLSLHLQMKN